MENNCTKNSIVEEVRKSLEGNMLVTMYIAEKGGIPETRMFRIKDVEHCIELPLSDEFEPWRVDSVEKGEADGEMGVLIKKSNTDRNQYFWFFPEDPIKCNMKFEVTSEKLYVMNHITVTITTKRGSIGGCDVETVKDISPRYRGPILFAIILNSKDPNPVLTIYAMDTDSQGNIVLGDTLYREKFKD